jgi:hypothetical protein
MDRTMDETDGERTTIELTRAELEILRTALRLLASTLGREEADELAEVQRLLTRLEGVDR